MDVDTVDSRIAAALGEDLDVMSSSIQLDVGPGSTRCRTCVLHSWSCSPPSDSNI